MMHQPCNNFYDSSRVLENYYYYSSPPLFHGLHHQYVHGDGDNNNVEAEFFQDLLENHHDEMAQQHNPLENNIVINNNNNDDDDDNSKRVGFDNKINSPRKKIISKKDRHTKIETAQGPRDRRMRLSLITAKKFFNLQDMLGFDKASQTVEWLLTKSLSSIIELSRSLQHQVGANSSVSSTSDIVMDDLSSSTNANFKKGRLNNNINKNSETKKVARTIRPLARESRAKARERARQRTKEKMSNLQKRRELGGTSYVGHASRIPYATYYHNLQENDGIIHEVAIPELKHLSENLGEPIASIW